MGYIVLVGSKYSISSILFPWCASVCRGMFIRLCSIFIVKSSLFAFLQFVYVLKGLVYFIVGFDVEGSDSSQMV